VLRALARAASRILCAFALAPLPILLSAIAEIGWTQTIRENLWATNGTVRAIAEANDAIYIGGDFTYVGPVTGSAVAIDAATGDPVVIPKSSYPKIR